MTNTNNSDKEVSDIAGALLPVSQAPISQVPTSLSPATEASLRQFGSAPILLGSSILIMVVSYLAMPVYTVADEIGYMLRVTARLAFVLLILAYTATALMRLFRVGYVFSLARWLRKNRRYLGLSMALVHTVHFGYVVSLFVYTEAGVSLGYRCIWWIGLCVDVVDGIDLERLQSKTVRRKLASTAFVWCALSVAYFYPEFCWRCYRGA